VAMLGMYMEDIERLAILGWDREKLCLSWLEKSPVASGPSDRARLDYILRL